MPHLAHLHQHYRRFGQSRRYLYLFSLAILFWTIFNGVISYLVPNLITETGFSHARMGLILASSSVWGAVFDLVIAKYSQRVSYRWFFLLLIAVSFAFPLIIWRNSSFWLFLTAMAVWGFYFDLANFGTVSFISHEIPKEEYAGSFGVVSVFKSLGYLVAPLLIGWKFSQFLDRGTLSLLWLFLLFSLGFFLILFWQRRRSPRVKKEVYRPMSLLRETAAWWKLGRQLWPVLVLVVFLNIWDAFFWTLGPLVGSRLAEINLDGGMFMAAYVFPSLLAGWLVAPVAQRLGKKKTAFVCLLAGGMVLAALALALPAGGQLAVVGISSLLTALAWPSISGAFADYVEEAPVCEKEIEGLQDFAGNWGYIIGPVTAGVVSTVLGETKTFAVLGAAGVVLAVVLLKLTPKKIKIKTEMIAR